MAFSMEQFTPRTLIAGRLTGSKGRALSTAVGAAAAILGTPQVAIICSSENDVVWYLAAPASDLASHMTSACALAAALPQTADHKGDGAYVMDLEGGLQVVVVKRADTFQSFVGSPAMVQRFVAMEGASTTYECTGSGMPWTLPAAPAGGGSGRLTTAVTAAGLLVGLLGAGVWMWAAAQVSAYQQEAEDLQLVRRVALQSAVKSLTSDAYPAAITNLQHAVDQCAVEGTTLVGFEHKNGHSTWSIKLNNQIVNRSAN